MSWSTFQSIPCTFIFIWKDVNLVNWVIYQKQQSHIGILRIESRWKLKKLKYDFRWRYKINSGKQRFLPKDWDWRQKKMRIWPSMFYCLLMFRTWKFFVTFRSATVEPDMKGKVVYELDDPNRPRFTLAELKDILQERNSLKVS